MGLLAAGVADQDVQSAQLLDSLGHQLLAEGLLAQVAGNGDALRPACLISCITSCASGSSVGR